MEIVDFKPEDFNIQPSDVQFGKELGRGNFSTVYIGKYMDKTVAIKKQTIVDPDLERYLMKELTLLRYMRSPHVIEFYGAFREGTNIANILTEYVEGGDLRRLIQDKSTPLGWKLRAQIAHDCLEGIRYLHERDLIHRDIKTENVLLDADCKPKICDFGFARKMNKGGPTMTMCGTEEFMAPEIMFGMSYDEKADIFSFGIMLAEVVTRKMPGKGDGFLDRSPRHGFGIGEVEEFDKEYNNVNCPPSLLLLSKEMLADSPESRPSAKDSIDWLADLVKELPDDSEPRPNLSAEKIIQKLDAYIKKSDDPSAEAQDTGSMRPKNDDARKRIMDALKARDNAIHNSDKFQPIQGTARDGTASIASGATDIVNAGGGMTSLPLDSVAPKSITQREPVDSDMGLIDKIMLCVKSLFGKEKVGAAAMQAPDWERQVGWVIKRGGRVKTWKRRFMVLTALGIVYFRTEEAKPEDAQGSIEFAEMTEVAGTVCNVVPTVMTGKPNSFGVHSLKRTYYMAAETSMQRDAWIKAICDGYLQFHQKKKKGKKGKKTT